MAAELFTDFPEKFAERERLFALQPDGNRRELQLQEHWPHKGWMVLKFEGVDSIEDAEALLKCELQIPLEERAELEEGATFISDLKGCRVFDMSSDSAVEVGEIYDVEFGAGEAPVLVVRNGSQEVLVPYAERYSPKLELKSKRLEMVLPEGLLESQAPEKTEKAAAPRKRREIKQ